MNLDLMSLVACPLPQGWSDIEAEGEDFDCCWCDSGFQTQPHILGWQVTAKHCIFATIWEISDPLQIVVGIDQPITKACLR